MARGVAIANSDGDGDGEGQWCAPVDPDDQGAVVEQPGGRLAMLLMAMADATRTDGEQS